MRRVFSLILTILIVAMVVTPTISLPVQAATTPTPSLSFHGVPEMFLDVNKASKRPDEGNGNSAINPIPTDFVRFSTTDSRDPLAISVHNQYVLHTQTITVSGVLPNGQNITGTTIAVVDYTKISDNGYPMINAENLNGWISLLGGDPGYVNQNIVKYTVTPSNQMAPFDLYSLAQLVVLCGGKGSDYGFQSFNNSYSWVKYRSYSTYIQTRVPTADIGPLNPSYPVGQPISISGKAEAYSAYDTFTLIENFTVYNKTTNTQYTKMEAPGRYGPTWSKSYTFTPASSGTYEVTLYVTDYQKRKAETYPVKKTFTVGTIACTTPTTATLKISGQADKTLFTDGSYTMPSGKNTIASLVFSTAGTLKVKGTTVGTGTSFNNILVTATTDIEFIPANGTYCEFAYTFHPSNTNPDPGGTCDYIIHVSTYTSTGNGEINMDMPSDSDGPAVRLDARTDYLGLTSDITGTFYLGSTKLNETPGKSASLTTFSSDVFTLSFKSSDGTECWSKKFYLDTPTGDVKCPEITRGSSVISNGDVITDIPLNGSLVLQSTYQDENRNTQTAMLKWRVKRPDGTTVDFMWTDGDGDKRGWRLIDWHQLQIPYDPKGWPADKQLKFDLPGTYEISYYYDPEKAPWGKNNCPSWSIRIEISACTDLTVKTELNGTIQYTDGDGSPGNEYIVKLPSTMPAAAKFTLRYQQYNTSYLGNWVLKRTNDAVPIATGNSENPFNYVFTDGGSYILTVRTVIGGVTCEKTILISGTTCEGMTIEGYVNDRPIQRTGSGTADDPYVIKIKGGKSNSLELTMKNGSKSVEAAWLLRRGGTSIYSKNTNSFHYNLTDSPEVYTLEIKTDLGGILCSKYVRFQVDGVPTFECDEMKIDGFVNGTAIRPGGNGTAASPYTVKIIEGQTNDISITLELSGSDANVPAEWTLKKGNTSIRTETGYGFQYKLPDSTEIYTLMAKVKNKTDYCYVYIRFEKGSFTCNEIYLHASYNKMNYFNVAPAPGHTGTLTFKGNKLDRIVLLVGTRPDTLVDARLLKAKFEGPLPNQGTFDPDSVYERFNVPAGTYKFKITVDDPSFPILIGCTFTLTLVIDPDAGSNPDPGGGQDGGKLKINIYDSANRLLQSSSDGVWEREPARIEVMVDQAKIDAVFQKIDAEIQKAIDEKTKEYLNQYAPPDYEGVEVRPTPPAWNSKTNPATKWPVSLTMRVTGPGANQSFSLDPKLHAQSNSYTGTLTPTQTTWLSTLQTQKYAVKVDSFTIEVPYTVQFAVTYQKCEKKSPGKDPGTGKPLPEEKQCSPGSDSGQIASTFTINVQGDETRFEVFEPNAKGLLLHTAEWSEYHARDRYPQSKENDFYAGERMISRVQLEERHRHPFSKQFPVIQSSQAWILETGKRNTPLQSLLALQPHSPIVWGGPMQNIPKLGSREVGVDTPPMGDKQKGFQKGAGYHVYYRVQFAFGVDKGFSYPNKSGFIGHNLDDYMAPFFIIANAWERQGIRNHTSH